MGKKRNRVPAIPGDNRMHNKVANTANHLPPSLIVVKPQNRTAIQANAAIIGGKSE